MGKCKISIEKNREKYICLFLFVDIFYYLNPCKFNEISRETTFSLSNVAWFLIFLLYLQRQNSTESPTGLEEGLMTFTYKGVPLRFGFDCV